MQLPGWTRASPRNRRWKISSAERRRREELLIPLELSRLEERRVLSGFTFNIAPVITAPGASLTPVRQGVSSASNTGNRVSSLVTATTDTGKLGIAITSANSAGSTGNWQYSTDGTNWFNVGTVSDNSALLLDGADYVRFMPGTPYTTSASITYRAWDESTDTDTARVDVTSNGGTTAYSTGTASSSITIFPTLSISGTGATSILDDQTTTPFNHGAVSASVGDSDPNDLLTITVTQQLTGGATDSTLADGSLSGGGFLNNGDGTYTLGGVTASVATTDLQALVFTPTRGTAGAALNTTFQIQVADVFAPANTVADANTVVTVTGNVTPVLNGANNFAPIQENSTAVAGTQVSALIAGQTTDSNDSALGIAITATDNSHGQWEYSTDDSTWFNLGGETAQTAFLLDNSDFVRFVPATGFAGTSSITFVAWDGTSGTHLTSDDTTQYPGSGAFSSASATSSIVVYPLLSISGTGATSILDDQTTRPFENGTVNATIGASGTSDLLTVTITQQFSGGATDSTLADGSLSGGGFVNNGDGTYTLSGVTATDATAALQALVFTPTRGAAGLAVSTTFQIQVSEDAVPITRITDSGTVVTVTGDAAPILTGANNFPAIPENDSAGTSATVASLISGQSSDADGDTLGIAVTSISETAGSGMWQYSSDGGSNWSAISTSMSANSALLLAPTDLVRFVPNDGFVGEPLATIAFLAWDQTTGTVDTLDDTTQSPGSGGFSTASATASVTVYPVLSISGTGTTSILDDQTTRPFENGTVNASVGDSDASDLVTITITQQTGGATDSTLADGSLAGGGFVNNGDGTYTLSGVTATVATTDLQALVFTPTRGTAGVALNTTFQIQATDSFAPLNTVADSNSVLTVTGNVTPVLSGANNLAPIAENPTVVAGTQVSALIAGQTTDANDSALGIAVTAVNDSNGQWEYSTDDSTWFDLGGETTQSAFLLDNGDYVRFVPANGFVGMSSFTFVAWDGTSGTHLTADDSTQYPGSGAFSTASATASITVYPVLSISGTGTTSILDDQTTLPFENGTVSATIGDSDASDLVTITITQQTGGATDSTLADGSLAGGGFVNNGDGTYTLSGVTAAVATADLQALVFTPTRGTAGAALDTTFQIQVTDGFAPLNTVANSNTVLSVTGDATPILTGANNLPAIPESDATPSGATVASLISGQSSDSDGDALGIAVTNISESAGSGVWQYSIDGGSHWSAISTGASATSALLLAPTDRVRFLPNDGFVGEPLATITFLAWDQTTGTVDMPDDTTQLPGSRGFSTNTETASITVFPVLSISGTGATSLKDDQSVQPFANGSVDATIGDSDPADLLTITITQQTGGATDSTQVNGVLSSTDNFAGFVDNADGTYTLTVAAPNASAELQALLFIPNQGAVVGQTIDTTFQISVADSFAAVNNTAVDSATVVHVLSTANPILTGSNNLPPIPENDSSSLDSGTQVSNLPIGAGGSSGIAVTALDDSNGLWEYSTDDVHWTVIDLTPPSLPHTGPAPQYAFLLASSDFVRFLPSTGFVGNSTITYLAWNQDSGQADQLSPEVKPLTGTLSKNTATASITVYPVLSIQGTGASASLDDQTSQPFKSAAIGDSFSSEMVTITITQMNAGTHLVDSTYADGSLSSPDVAFTSNSLGVYTLTVAATDATADLQALVFAPTLHQVSPGQTVATQFTIQVSDAIFAPINTVVDHASILTVTANAVPQLTGANNFASIPEGVSTAADAGKTVASLISGKSSDADGDVLGIAISQVDDANGEWDYSTGIGQPWIPITGVSLSSVLLLAPTDLVRFFPNSTFFGNATIQFSAWDQTVGTSTKMFDSTALPGSGAFSTNTATATIQVVAPATIFVSSPNQSTNDETPVNVFASAFGSQMIGLPAPGITDPNTPIQNYTVTVTIGTPANGVFQFAVGSGWSLTSAGTYQFTGSAADANLALEGLVFVPTIHQVEPGTSVVTNFTISVNDAVTVPTSNRAISLTATAVNDAPTLVAASALFNVPVLAGNGAVIGADAATEVDFDPHISYAIIAGNPNGAYAIDSNGTLTVANSAALVYSATPTVLTITATNSGANGVAPAISTSTRSIALWEITASASAIGSDSSTMLSVALISGTPLTVPVIIDWSDGSTTRVTLSSTTPTAPIAHVYLTNPNQANPSASIPINVLYSAVGQQFDTETFAAVDGTGIGFIIIPHSVSSFVTLAPPPSFVEAPTATPFDLPDTDSSDVGVAQSQTTIGAERRIVLRIISPLEVEGKDIPLPDRAFNDLPGLFKKLPDGHYRVYLLEDGHERLVIDVLVRQGRPVDSSEDSGGAGDRPPTSQIDTGKSKEHIAANPDGDKTRFQSTAKDRTRIPPVDLQFLLAKSLDATRIVALPGSAHKPSMRTAGALSLYKADRAQAGHMRLNRSAATENLVAYAAAAAGTSAAAAIAIDRNRMDPFLEKLSRRSLSKGARLSRQQNRTTNVK